MQGGEGRAPPQVRSIIWEGPHGRGGRCSQSTRLLSSSRAPRTWDPRAAAGRDSGANQRSPQTPNYTSPLLSLNNPPPSASLPIRGEKGLKAGFGGRERWPRGGVGVLLKWIWCALSSRKTAMSLRTPDPYVHIPWLTATSPPAQAMTRIQSQPPAQRWTCFLGPKPVWDLPPILVSLELDPSGLSPRSLSPPRHWTPSPLTIPYCQHSTGAVNRWS